MFDFLGRKRTAAISRVVKHILTNERTRIINWERQPPYTINILKCRHKKSLKNIGE